MDHRRDVPPAAALFSTSSHAPPATSEDSALFSLQSLRDDALRRTESEPPRAEPSPIAVPATAQVPSEPAPMFNFNAGARLTMQPLSASPRPRARVSPPPAGVVYAALGLLAGVVIGMGALVLQDPPTVVVQRDDANTRGSLSVSEAQRRHVEGDLTVRRPSRGGKPPAKATEEPATVEDTSESSEAADTRLAKAPDTSERRATASRGSSSSRSSAKSTRSASVKNDPAEPPSPPATTKTTRASKSSQPDPSVACILDPASCGLGGASSSGSTSSTNKPTSKPTSKPADLPAKLTSSALRSALAPAKARASRCGEMHVVPGGTKVSVRLSIAGNSGKVTRATPQSPHDDAVGRCVANELAQTTFPRFASPSMGILYSVRL